MKSKMKRRMLAIVLCMVIVLSNSSFIFASSESGTPVAEAAGTEGTASQTETDTQVTETTLQTLAVSESTPAPTDEPAAPTSVEVTPTPTDTPEVTTTPEPTGTPTPEATPTPTDTPETTTTPEPTDAPEITTTPELTDTPEATTTPEPTNTPEATPTPTQGPEDGTSDTAQPTATPTPTEAPVKSNEAVELKQEFKDSDGNVTSTVKAQIPEGTFAADASEITMEVQTPDAASAEHVKEMMEELLPENHMLGDYIFYDIQFKVNGTVTEPQKSITITFEGEELSVKDVKRANVFWLDPEDPQVDGDKDQLVEITQKSEMIENLQNSGQSTENIDDYDLSEITLKEDGISDKIQMEGRTSTIYGCYVVYEPVQVLTYEDNQVTVTVSAAEEGIIPANAELKVVPITAEDKNTEDQYKEVEQKLQEKAEEDAYDIAGFLAYDITFVDEDGNETEPGGEVKVSIDYKEAAIPETISEEDAANAEVTVLHLEEDEKGEVKEVVDMTQDEKVDVLATTEENKVEKAEVRTESFSTFTIIWKQTGEKPFDEFSTEIHVVTSDADNYRGLDGINLENKEISSEGTPPTLYIDTISPSGDNSDLYQISTGDTDYRFTQAFVAEENWNDIYDLVYSDPIEALQAIKSNEVRYKLKDTGEYATLQPDEVIIFVYTSDSATTNASYYSEDGERLGGYQTYNYANIGSAESGVLVKGSEPSEALNFQGYTYAYTTIIKGGQELEPNYMRYVGGNLQYSMSEINGMETEREWIDVGIAEIRLIYIPYGSVPTVDTSEIVDIGLFDWAWDTNHKLHFRNGDGNSGIWNEWTGFRYFDIWNGGHKERHSYRNFALQGIVDDSLYVSENEETSATNNYTGYPKLSNDTGGEWLDYLFNPDNENAHTGLNHLFRIDSQGYYYYDSAENYAYLNTDNNNNNFTVYNQKKNKGDDDKGDFMPFDDINDNNDNFYFSMNIGFNFTQPEKGEVNNAPMIFEFSGDDDVWVFIDGKLVLDIGGIHDAVSGSINFKTGEILVKTGAKTGDAYYDENQNMALNLQGGRQTTQKYLSNIFNDLQNNTFKAGTTHRLEFFYLERGAGESNCSLKFNIQPQESQTIEVEKQIMNTDREKYSDINFNFKVYLQDNEGTDSYHVIPEGTEYTIKRDGKEIGTGKVGPNGIFSLKHGESAIFSDISPKLYYRVEEVSVDSDEFDKVEIDGKDASYFDQNGNEIEAGEGGLIEEGDFIASTDYLLVGEYGKVTFYNHCNGQNLHELQITKVMQPGETSDGDVFTFKVSLENRDGELEPYNGEYYLQDEKGQYYYYDDNNTLVPSPSARSCGTTEDGLITNVAVGWKVSIVQIMSGTDFKVEEVNLNEGLDIPKYDLPTYTVAPETAEKINNSEGSGTILLGKNATVTVTNSLLAAPDAPYIEVQKKFEGIDAGKLPENFAIGLYKDEQCTQIVEYLTLNDKDVIKSEDGLTYTWRLYGREEGTYYLKEEGTDANDYILDKIIVNRSEVSSGETIKVTTKNPTFEVVGEIEQIDKNNETEFDFDTHNFIAAILQDQSCFVWTKEPLSMGERQAIVEIVKKAGHGNLSNKITVDGKTRYYSTVDRLEEGIDLGFGKIYVEDGKLKFTSPSQWQHVIAGQYTRTNAVNAEIEITNSYIPETVDIDLQKFGTKYDSPQAGAVFTLYSGTKGSNSITWQVKQSDIAVDNASTAHELKLENGYYKLEETTAPAGFVKLDKPIYFRVDGQNVYFTDKDGVELSGDDSKPDMWQIKNESGVWTIQVLNKALYDLPSSGSSGIFGYTMGGTLLLMAGTLILYKMKRKEVQES